MLATSVAGCGRQAAIQSDAAAPPPAPVAGPVVVGASDYVPPGTLVELALNQSLSSETNRVGDRFTATFVSPVVSAGGDVMIPQGAVASGVVTRVETSEGAGDQALIGVRFDQVSFEGRSLPFAAEVVEADVETDRRGRDVATGAGVGALAGAALGAIITGDVGGAVAGGAVGAGGGSLIGLGAGDVQAILPQGSRMTVRTTQAVSTTY